MLRSRLRLGPLLVAALCVQGAVAASPDQAGALAGQPSAAAPAPRPLDARALGVEEALLDYCAKNDPAGAVKVRTRLRGLVRGASKETLDQARQSDAYRGGHESELDFIGKIEIRNAHRLCFGRVVQSK